MLAESFRIVLGSLLLSVGKSDAFKILVVTSPKSGDGKTTVTSNLAMAIAEAGQSVLVIDADLRKPTMHKIFGLENENGLYDLLKSPALAEQNIESTIKESRIPNLSVLTAGEASGGSAAILYSVQWQQLLDSVRDQYQMILVDTPPLLLFPEARGWGRVADGVILVVRADQTRKDQAEAARDKLRNDSTPIIGTVLNGWAPVGGDKQYNAYSSYPNVFA